MPCRKPDSHAARLQVSWRLIPDGIGAESRNFIHVYGSGMIPVVRVKPNAPGMQCPFLVERSKQQPGTKPPSVGCWHKPKVLQLDFLRAAAFEFTEPQGLTGDTPKYVDLTLSRPQQAPQFLEWHLEPLVPSKGFPDAPI